MVIIRRSRCITLVFAYAAGFILPPRAQAAPLPGLVESVSSSLPIRSGECVGQTVTNTNIKTSGGLQFLEYYEKVTDNYVSYCAQGKEGYSTRYEKTKRNSGIRAPSWYCPGTQWLETSTLTSYERSKSTTQTESSSQFVGENPELGENHCREQVAEFYSAESVLDVNGNYEVNADKRIIYTSTEFHRENDVITRNQSHTTLTTRSLNPAAPSKVECWKFSHVHGGATGRFIRIQSPNNDIEFKVLGMWMRDLIAEIYFQPNTNLLHLKVNFNSQQDLDTQVSEDPARRTRLEDLMLQAVESYLQVDCSTLEFHRSVSGPNV